MVSHVLSLKSICQDMLTKTDAGKGFSLFELGYTHLVVVGLKYCLLVRHRTKGKSHL